MNRFFDTGVQALRMVLGLGMVSACGLMLNAGTDSTNCATVPPGLVGWWRGEGNATDVVSGANGALYGSVTFASGKVGRCFAFDGINGGINLPDVPALALTGSLSIEGWLLVADVVSVSGMVIFRGDTRSGLDPYYVSVEPRPGTSGVLNFVVWGRDNMNASVTALMPIGTWIHVAATLDDANGLMRLYTNAVVAAETMTDVRPLRRLDPQARPGIGIGNHSSQPGPFNYPFHGLIDELSLYNRALSDCEIQAIYNAGSVGKCSLSPGL
jgi:hypothetical protein